MTMSTKTNSFQVIHGSARSWLLQEHPTQVQTYTFDYCSASGLPSGSFMPLFLRYSNQAVSPMTMKAQGVINGRTLGGLQRENLIPQSDTECRKFRQNASFFVQTCPSENSEKAMQARVVRLWPNVSKCVFQFPGVCLKPLSHLSARAASNVTPPSSVSNLF